MWDNSQLAGTLLHLSQFHLSIRQYRAARHYAEQALTLAGSINFKPLLVQARESLKLVALDELDDHLTRYLKE